MQHVKVRLLSGDSHWPWTRQLPDSQPIWGQTEFAIGDEPFHTGGAEDWLVVYETVPTHWATSHDRSRTILFCGEPPTIKDYSPAYLAQFGTVVTTDNTTAHPNAVVSQVALPWHVGIDMRSDRISPRLEYNDFLEVPKKTKLCSVITSNKTMTREHRARLAFVERLQREFNGLIDFYGRGINEIDDKDQALAEYRFHIALENSRASHYFTEKLSDPILRGCYPMYFGAPNLADYIGAGAFTEIDVRDVDQAISIIRNVLNSDLDDRHAEAVGAARQKIMEECNIFAVIDRLVHTIDLPRAAPKILRPESRVHRLLNSVRRRIASRL